MSEFDCSDRALLTSLFYVVSSSCQDKKADCSWYVKEQREMENNKKLRGVAKAGRRSQRADGAMSLQTYREKLLPLLDEK